MAKATVATLLAGLVLLLAFAGSVHGQTSSSKCDSALLAMQVAGQVYSQCSTYQPNAPPLCQVFFEYYVSQPKTKPSLAQIPVLGGNLSSLTDWAPAMIQDMLSAGVMSQSGDVGEMMYVVNALQSQWSAVAPSNATQGNVLGPWQQGFYDLAARLVVQASNQSNGWDEFSRASALRRAARYDFIGQWPFPTTTSSLDAMKRSTDNFNKGILSSPEWGGQATFINATLRDPATNKILTDRMPVLFTLPPAAASAKNGTIPLIVFTTGLDFPWQEMWSWYAPGALKRGYAVAFFDGPGQGAVLNQPPNLPFVPRWDSVVATVLDTLQAHPAASQYVNFSRTALMGYSTGGWLAATACKGLPSRIKACVLNPGVMDLSDAFLQPTAAGMFGPLTFIAQQAPELLQYNTSSLFLDASNRILRPLVGDCTADSMAPGILQEFLSGAATAVPDPDQSYLSYAFTGYRAQNASDLWSNVWASYRAVLPFNSTLTVNSTVPTLVLQGVDDAEEGAQSFAYMDSLAPEAKAKSSIAVFNAASGGALHCQNGAVLAAEAQLYAWLRTAL